MGGGEATGSAGDATPGPPPREIVLSFAEKNPTAWDSLLAREPPWGRGGLGEALREVLVSNSAALAVSGHRSAWRGSVESAPTATRRVEEARPGDRAAVPVHSHAPAGGSANVTRDARGPAPLLPPWAPGRCGRRLLAGRGRREGRGRNLEGEAPPPAPRWPLPDPSPRSPPPPTIAPPTRGRGLQ